MAAKLLWERPATNILKARADATFKAGTALGTSDAVRRRAYIDAARLARAVGSTGAEAQQWLTYNWALLGNTNPLELAYSTPCVLELIAHLPLKEWTEVRPALFGVCHIFCTAGEGAICPFFTALTELLLRWLAALRGRGTLKPNGPCVPLSEGDLILGVYEFETLRQYVGFVDQCAQNALQDERTSTAVHLAVMGFFEQVGRLHTACNVPFMVVPSYPVAQRCLLHPAPIVVSQLCGLLAAYRQEIEGLKACYNGSSLSRTARAGANGLQDIPRFNSFVLDACNALWRNRAFVDSAEPQPQSATAVDEQLSCLRLPKATLENLHVCLGQILVLNPGEASNIDQSVWGSGGRTTYELRRTLSITHGAAWQGHVRAFLQTEAAAAWAAHDPSHSEPPPAPTVHALEAAGLKAAYLDELRREGYNGLYDFLHAFISSLARRQQRSSGQP